MLNGDLQIKLLSDEIRQDFYKVHQAGEYGNGCLCGFWWVPSAENWEQRTDQESIDQREELFSRGVQDGYILYWKDEPVGWCQAYQRDQLPNLVNTLHLSSDPEVWCISCFMLIPQVRGQGLAHKFLAAVLEDLKLRGVKIVQAYPRSQGGLDANEIWTGPEALFLKAGFRKVQEQPRRSVWEKGL